LDHDAYLPSFAVVTEGKHSELQVARSLQLEPGTILAINRCISTCTIFNDIG
jgi:hypothetical protein